jgi:hypothetical protein
VKPDLLSLLDSMLAAATPTLDARSRDLIVANLKKRVSYSEQIAVKKDATRTVGTEPRFVSSAGSPATFVAPQAVPAPDPIAPSHPRVETPPRSPEECWSRAAELAAASGRKFDECLQTLGDDLGWLKEVSRTCRVMELRTTPGSRSFVPIEREGPLHLTVRDWFSKVGNADSGRWSLERAATLQDGVPENMPIDEIPISLIEKGVLRVF